MTGSLTRLEQIAAIVETTPGTLNSSVYAASEAQHLISGANVTFDFPVYTRDIKRPTLTPLPGLSGRQQGSVTFAIELAGESSGGIPPWSVFMRACGWQRRALKKITIGTITSGPFRHGETVTQATSGATAKVFLDTYNGTSRLYVWDVRGTPDNSHTWTGGTSSASATPATVATTAGHGWEPVDVPTLLVTATGTSGTVAVGETVTGGTSGAAGVVQSIETHTLTVTGVSGTVAVNDVATGGSSGAVAVVDSIISTTSFRVRIRGATLFSGAETITFAGSGASATHSSTIQGQFAIRVYNALYFTGSETLTFSSGETATHSSNTQQDMPTLTIACYQDGNRWTLAGCRGTWQLSAATGEPAKLNFTFTGAFADSTDAAMLTGVTYPLNIPPTMLGAAVTVRTEGDTSTYSARFDSISLDAGNAVEYRTSASSVTGVIETLIGGRNGSGSFDPEADLEASYEFVGNFANNQVGGLSFTVGSVANNTFQVQIPGMRINSVGTGARGTIRTRQIGFECTGGSMANVSDSPNERNDILVVYT